MLRLYADAARRKMSLLLDITLPRVAAEGNVHQKARQRADMGPLSAARLAACCVSPPWPDGQPHG